MSNTSELAVSYACLILADDDVEITPDKVQAIAKAANVEIEPIWASLFAKALEGKNAKDLFMKVGAGGGGGAPAAGAAGGAAGAPAAEEKEPEKEEEKEESDEDMGFGLFD